MKNNNKLRWLVGIWLPLALLMAAPAFSDNRKGANIENARIGVTYLMLMNSLGHERWMSGQPKQSQFDAAVNLNFDLTFNELVTGTAQLQGGAGEGSFGFVGPGVEVTDLNVNLNLERQHLDFTLGSFDTPFGDETNYLTNNADATGNDLFLNSLLYTALVNGPAGTLNTLGLMAHYNYGHVEITMAVSNGTDESAANQDGNFELAGRVSWLPLQSNRLRLTGSLIYSDDASSTGENGTVSKFSAGLVEMGYSSAEDKLRLRSYFGQLDYDDRVPETEDRVYAWMAGASYGPKPRRVAARVSGWMPENDDGDGLNVSTRLPSPATWYDRESSLFPQTDQEVVRFQLGGSIILAPGLEVKAEFFRESYQYDVQAEGGSMKSPDVNGLIVALNGGI